MSDLQPKPIPITLGGQKFGLLFSLNVIDEVQDHFDIPISQLTNFIKDERTAFRCVRYLLTRMINEAIDDEENGRPHVEEKWVGRKVTAANIGQMQSDILLAFADGTPEVNEDEVGPNPQSE